MLPELEQIRRDDGQNHGYEDSRDLRHHPLQDADHRQAEQADRESGRHRFAVRDAVQEPPQLVDETVGVHGEPEQLGQLPDQDRESQAVHVADHGRLREQVGYEAELRDSAGHHERSHQQREHRRERDCTLRVAVGSEQGQDRGRDHRPERGVGPEHEDLRWPEDRVPGQTEDRGVETGDRGKARELGVCHSLRDEKRGQNQARDDVPGSPAGPV